MHSSQSLCSRLYIGIYQATLAVVFKLIHMTYRCIYGCTYLPYSTCIVVFSVSNPSVWSTLHWKTSPLLASVIVIVEKFPPAR